MHFLELETKHLLCKVAFLVRVQMCMRSDSPKGIGWWSQYYVVLLHWNGSKTKG